MIKGQIAVTWSEADYKNLTWVTNKVHEEKFNATVDTQNYNVGVYMCFENLPTKFYDAVKDLELNKVVVAVNKLTPGQILPYHTDKYKTYKERNGITEQDEDDIGSRVPLLDRSFLFFVEAATIRAVSVRTCARIPRG